MCQTGIRYYDYRPAEWW